MLLVSIMDDDFKFMEIHHTYKKKEKEICVQAAKFKQWSC